MIASHHVGISKRKTPHDDAEEIERDEQREVYLRDGRKLVVSEQGGDQLVEIRSESGMLEVRIRLTEEGPVLQMEARGSRSRRPRPSQIESKRVEIKAESRSSSSRAARSRSAASRAKRTARAAT